MTATDKQHAHSLIDRIPAAHLPAAVRFLEFLLTTATQEEDEEISAEEEQAVARSMEWFQRNEGIPFEQLVADLGISMDHIRANAGRGPAAEIGSSFG